MEYIVVTTGDDPLTKACLEYLDRTYGMPAKDIRSINLQSTVGDVQTITVTLFVRTHVPEVL